jgi:hypothetical protein
MPERKPSIQVLRVRKQTAPAHVRKRQLWAQDRVDPGPVWLFWWKVWGIFSTMPIRAPPYRRHAAGGEAKQGTRRPVAFAGSERSIDRCYVGRRRRHQRLVRQRIDSETTVL